MESTNEFKAQYKSAIDNGYEHLRAVEIALSNVSYNETREVLDDRVVKYHKGIFVKDYVLGYELGKKDQQELDTHTDIEGLIDSALSMKNDKFDNAGVMVDWVSNKLSSLREALIRDVVYKFDDDAGSEMYGKSAIIQIINRRFDEVTKEHDDLNCNP